jgi:hypothetical protein
MWLVGRAATAEVTPRNDALLRTVYRESRGLVGIAEAWLILRALRFDARVEFRSLRQILSGWNEPRCLL